MFPAAPRLGWGEKIGGANASGVQLSNRRKAGAASVSMVTAKLGQPPSSHQEPDGVREQMGNDIGAKIAPP